MKQTRFLKSLSLIVCVVLMAAMALCASGCNDNTTNGGDTVTTTTVSQETPSQDAGNVKGEGATAFTFAVTGVDGKETVYEIRTDKTTVGEALLDVGLIAGEQGDYGLYVKTVDGVTLDYDKDGKYWAFYVDGEYAMAGVDATTITAGASYAFKAE